MYRCSGNAINGIRLHSLKGRHRYCSRSCSVLALFEGALRLDLPGGRECSASGEGVFWLPPGAEAVVSAGGEEPAVLLVMRQDPVFVLESPAGEALLSTCFGSDRDASLLGLLPVLRELAEFASPDADPGCLRAGSLLLSFLDQLGSLLPTGQEDGGPELRDAGRKLKNPALVSWMRQGLRGPVSLQEAAERCGLTPQYLASFFRKTMGCTLLEYMGRRKADLALRCLARAGLSAEDAAAAVGFRSVAAFEKSVRAAAGQGWAEVMAARPCLTEDFPAETVVPDTALPRRTGQILPAGHGAARPLPASARLLPPVFADCSGAKEELSDSWRMIINVGPAHAMSSEKLRFQLREMRARVPFVYARFYQILDLVTLQKSGGRVLFDFEQCFQLLDFLRSVGFLPMLELGHVDYRPVPGIAADYYMRSDMDIATYLRREQEILPEFIRAVCNRYGRAYVGKWLFEFHFSFTSDREFTFHQFLQQYRKMERSIRALIPEAGVGGCGFTVSVSEKTLSSLYEMIAASGVRMDFLSFHVNGITSEKARTEEKLFLASSPLFVDRRLDRILALTEVHFPGVPLYVTEYGFAHYTESFLSDSVFQSTFICRFLNRCMDRFAGLGCYMLSDISLLRGRSEEMFFGGSGLFNCSSLLKPSGYAFRFFSLLGSTVLARGEDYLVTGRSLYSFQILTFRHADISPELCGSPAAEDVLAYEQSLVENGPPEERSFRISGAIPGLYLKKTFRLHPEAGNVLSLWKKQAPDIHSINGYELWFFEHAAYPDINIESVSVDDSGVISVSAEVRPLETALILFDHITQI